MRHPAEIVKPCLDLETIKTACPEPATKPDVAPTAAAPVAVEPVEPVVVVKPKATKATATPRYQRSEGGLSLDEFVNELERQGYNPKKRGAGYTALCPGHDDQNPSLDIDPGNKRPFVTICRSAGCTLETILDAMGIKGAGYEQPIKTPYHVRKGVKVHSPAYLSGDDLIVPLMDIRGNKNVVQTIWPEQRVIDGKSTDKMTKGTPSEEYFFMFGDTELSDTLLIATGYATSASIFESTGNPVIMSLSDTTLPRTIEIIRSRYAEKELIVCCDHDARNNKKILDMVNRCNALLCYPTIADKPKADFNDLMLRSGKEAVCEVISDAKKPEGVDSINDADSVCNDEYDKPPAKGINGADLLLKLFAPVIWLLPDLLPNIGVYLLAGKQKLGKSWFALALALAHIYGGKFLNRSIPKGKVLYLGLEDSERRMKERIIKLQPDAVNDLSIFNNIRFFHATDNVPRLDQGFVQFIEPYTDGVSLLVVDILQKIRPLKSSGNVYQDDYLVITALQALALKHSMCVLALTHTRKQDAEDAFDTIMSSGGLSGAADGALVLARKRGNGATILHTTGRDIIENEHGLQFNAGVWSYAGTAEEVKATTEQNEVFNLLREAGAEGMTTKEICDDLGKREPAIRALLRELADAGRVRKRETKPAPRYAVCDGSNAPPI